MLYSNNHLNDEDDEDDLIDKSPLVRNILYYSHSQVVVKEDDSSATFLELIPVIN